MLFVNIARIGTGLCVHGGLNKSRTLSIEVAKSDILIIEVQSQPAPGISANPKSVYAHPADFGGNESSAPVVLKRPRKCGVAGREVQV